METLYKKLLLCLAFLSILLLLPITSLANGDESDDDAIEEETSQIEAQSTESSVLDQGFEENRPQYVYAPNGMIEDHRLIAENNRLELYVNETTLSIITRDKATSAVLYSTVSEPEPGHNQEWQNFMTSGVIIEFLTPTTTIENRLTLHEPGTKIDFRSTINGFEADVFFPQAGIGYTLVVELTTEGFTATIPYSSLIEEGNNLISGLYIFPFLGYAHLGDRDGYMFVPDGSGILINLQDNEDRFNQPFAESVYGSNVGVWEGRMPNLLEGQSVVQDVEPILMPVFGMVHTDAGIGFLGIIEGGGQFHSVIEAFPNGVTTTYDWISSRFVYRQIFSQPINQAGSSIRLLQETRNSFDATLNFKIETGESANYTGLALAYQRHLLDTGMLTILPNDFRIRLDFLGLEQESGMFFNRNVVMTSIADIESILNSLNVSGVENILAVYQGWQRRGASVGSLIQDFNVAPALGDNRSLLNLISSLENTGIDIFLFHDPLRMPNNVSSRRITPLRGINRQVYEEETNRPMVSAFNFLEPNSMIDVFMPVQDQYLQSGIKNLMLTGVSNQVFSYYQDGIMHDRFSTASEFSQLLTDVNDSFNVILDQPFSYLWNQTNALINTPVSGSSFVFTSQEVPFLSIVLRGIMPMYSQPVNFEANRQEFILSLIEHGVNPSFLLTMQGPDLLQHTNSRHIFTSEFSLFEEDIVNYYHELNEVFRLTASATVASHERNNNVVTMHFSNGVYIHINYNAHSVQVGDTFIEGISYKVGGY